MIGGVWHKRCSGPAHEEVAWLPATEKFFIRRGSKGGRWNAGNLHSRCRLCNAWSHVKSPGSNHGYVETRAVREMFAEAITRIGKVELQRRSGVSQTVIDNVMLARTRSVQKEKARRVILELISARRKGEFASPRSRESTIRRVSNGERCEGCSMPLSDKTDGCSVCRSRHEGKTCPKCHRHKRAELFSVDRSNVDNLTRWCKACRRAYWRSRGSKKRAERMRVKRGG